MPKTLNSKPADVVDVNGTQVFSADYVFAQEQALSKMIDHANAIACVALIVAACSLIVSAIMLLR